MGWGLGMEWLGEIILEEGGHGKGHFGFCPHYNSLMAGALYFIIIALSAFSYLLVGKLTRWTEDL